MRLNVIPIFLLVMLPLTAQLEVEVPMTEETPEPVAEEEVDAEAVRSLARQIQGTGLRSDPAQVPQNHPGRLHFETVTRRLLSGPASLSVRITLVNGIPMSVRMPNQLLTVLTPAGPFPVRMSELVHMEAQEGDVRFALQGGDSFSGKLHRDELSFERADTRWASNRPDFGIPACHTRPNGVGRVHDPHMYTGTRIHSPSGGGAGY